MMNKIVSFSGGKDSTAMLLLMIDQGIPFDEIVYFDAGTWEFEQMRDHINKVEKYIGQKITRLESEKGFDYWFSDHVITRGQYAGTKGNGFPSINRRWCTREKIRTINKYVGRHEVSYIGFAYDEKHRVKTHESKAFRIEYPLIDAKMTEKQALRYCYSHGFDWGGLYNIFHRVSCWCCPLQNDKELKNLHDFFPEKWRILEEMQGKSWNSFRMSYKKIQDYTEEYKNNSPELS